MIKFSLFIVITALTAAFAAAAADIIGTITLIGTPPPEVPYTPLMNDSTCGAMYKTAPTTHFYAVGPNHELADVIVSLKGVTGKSTGASRPPVTLDQKGCLYVPQILAIQTGQKLVIKNSDSCIHNVHCVPAVSGNPESNQVQMPGGPDLDYTFSQPERFMKFKCDVHPWMFAWVTVLDSPYYGISDKDGKFIIKQVPPGKYTVAADHRKLGTITKDVEVKDGDVTVNFTFDVK
jgi:plastocyanin